VCEYTNCGVEPTTFETFCAVSKAAPESGLGEHAPGRKLRPNTHPSFSPLKSN
jgi:hypothetical protein